jgi:hypothetical protein
LKVNDPSSEARMPGPSPPVAAAATTTTRKPNPLDSGVVASRKARNPSVSATVPMVATA